MSLKPDQPTDRPKPEAHLPIRVSIVEDEDWMRENLAREIDRSPAMCCVSRYRTAEEALEGIPASGAEVVLMDINLPSLNGIECLRRLKASCPKTQFLMLTVYEDSDQIFNSLVAGASGYLLKRTNTAELLEAIQQVREGGSPISSHIARKVVQFFNQMGEGASELARLSSREREVLDLLAKGAAYKEIADLLSLSIETIRMYVKHIYSKLHVHSRGEAVAKFWQRP